MDSGVVLYVPLIFLGAVVVTYLMQLLLERAWVAIVAGSVVPPSVMLLVDLLNDGAAPVVDDELIAAVGIIWAVGFLISLAGALCGIWLAARAKRHLRF